MMIVGSGANGEDHAQGNLLQRKLEVIHNGKGSVEKPAAP